VKLCIVAVGQRPPAWAEAAYDEYARRFARELTLELRTVRAEPRGAGRPVDVLRVAEARRIEAALPKGSRRIVLDERGERATTARLADRLRFWMRDGRDVAFLIGGADGLDPALKSTADESLRLSDLTLPHALVRVLLAEALYRAWSVTTGHPYHRE
jgi:23S rRNA (pseudouridine1915-N3)-methyltransferase